MANSETLKEKILELGSEQIELSRQGAQLANEMIMLRKKLEKLNKKFLDNSNKLYAELEPAYIEAADEEELFPHDIDFSFSEELFDLDISINTEPEEITPILSNAQGERILAKAWKAFVRRPE